MVRADLFALLSVSEYKEFFKDDIESNCVKSAVCKIQESDKRFSKFLKSLNGWNMILDKKCFSNNIVDTMVVNKVTFLAIPENFSENLFVFAGFLDPGYHQFII